MGATLPRALTCAEVNARRAVDPEVADIEELARRLLLDPGSAAPATAPVAMPPPVPLVIHAFERDIGSVSVVVRHYA